VPRLPSIAACLIAVAVAGCRSESPPLILPGPVGSEAVSLSRSAAAVAAGREANRHNPEGLPRQAVDSELVVAAAGLPPPLPADLAAALARSNLVLQGRLEDASRRYAEAEGEMAQLREAAARERAEAAARMREELAKARSQAERESRRLVGLMFFGGALVSAVAGGLMLSVASGLPLVGPRVVAGAFALSAVLAGMGVTILQAMSRPWVVWAGLAAAVAVLVGTLALAYANHWHGKPSTPESR
jgi:hypothetical protein